MNCQNCGAELLAGKQFCHVCGARVTLSCPKCGVQVEPGFRFCPDCGGQIDADPGDRRVAPAATGALARLSDSMPKAMADKILASRGLIEGERKQVTVLFCDLAGSTAVAGKLDPEEYHDLLDQYLALAFREIYRFEGIVNQLAGDGLMALFGAPIAHEDDPERAVWAALAIRDALAHFNQRLGAERGLQLPARIGINTGLVVVGAVGNDLKMDYTAVGDTTNLAARLEALAAPGAVLISEATARLARGFFRTRQVGPFEVKGKSEEVTAYEVLDVLEAASPMAVAAERGLTALVGRDAELAQLAACFQRLDGLLTQVVSLVGEAGSGKSRLIHEFKQRLADEQVILFEARCSALHRLEPYYPYVVMLRSYFGLTSEGSAQAAYAGVAEKAGMTFEEIGAEFPHLCRLLSVPVYDTSDLPPQELQREMLQAIGNLVIKDSRRAPVVMIVEDLHWMDDQSREILEMAVSRLARARVMVLVSHRPEYRTAWRTGAAVTQLTLRPLSDGEITQIMRSLAGSQLPEELEKRILAKAEGSPFFAEEITRSLLEEGFLTCDAGSCRLSRPVDELPIPGSVQEVLAARLDRLGAAAKRVAQVAAVLGRQFGRSQLEQLLAPENIEVEREVAELERRGVIRRTSLFSADEHRFGESLTQEVAYESLLLKQRRQLHERVGQMLEAGGGTGPLERPSLIAHHYALSDNREKAIETLLRAAEDAERLPAYRAALDLYRQAWELSDAAAGEEPDGERRARQSLLEATLGYCRVVVMYGSSHDPDAQRAAERGCQVAESLGDLIADCSFHTYKGLLLGADRRRFAEGLALVEKSVTMAEQLGGELQVIGTSRALAWYYLLDGRFAAARDKVDWLVERLERLGQGGELSDLYLGSRFLRSQILFYGGALDAAMREGTAAQELSVRAGNRTVQSISAGLIANVHFLRGDYEEARSWADRSLESAESIGVAAAIHRSAILALATRVDLGEVSAASRYAELAERGIEGGAVGLPSVLPLVESLLALGNGKQAERIARAAYERAAGRLREMLSAAALAGATLQMGPAYWAETEQCYLRSSSLAEELGAQLVLAVSAAGLGELALVRGQHDLAAARFRRALVLSRAGGFGRYESRVEQLLVEVGEHTQIDSEQVASAERP